MEVRLKPPADSDTAYMLGEVRSDIKSVLKKLDEISVRQEKHESSDSARIAEIHDRIDSMNKYAASIALVACAIGASIKALYVKIMGG